MVTSGTCTHELYWGGPLSSGRPTTRPSRHRSRVAEPGHRAVRPGANAAGLPTSDIAQTDDFSGGSDRDRVADVADTSPMEGETVYGAFTALAEASDGVSPIGVTITNGNR